MENGFVGRFHFEFDRIFFAWYEALAKMPIDIYSSQALDHLKFSVWAFEKISSVLLVVYEIR